MAAWASFQGLAHAAYGFWGAPADYGTKSTDHMATRQAVMSALRSPAPELIVVQQVHSATVVDACEVPVGTLAKTPADAVLSNEPGRAVGVLTADCVPLLMLAPDCGWVAAVHAGRVGALAEIVPKTVAALERHGAQREHLKIAVGPHIAAASYEVGEALFATLPKVAQAAQRDGRLCCDLQALIQAQLDRLNIHADQVEWNGIDTCSNPEWHSYRRDGAAAGRNLSVITVPSDR
jgi:polyphenol oxidase